MFPTLQEVAENRARKRLPANRIFVPESERCICLKCGGVARKYNGGNAEGRECVECDFMWEVEDGILRHGKMNNVKWTEVPEGLLFVLWEREV